MIADVSPPHDEGFIEKLKALASGVDIIKVLASHKPDPVPVHVISEELRIKQSTTSMHLRRLRRVRLIGIVSRRKGYFAESAEIRAVIGEQNYTRITQGLSRQNGDAPGLS